MAEAAEKSYPLKTRKTAPFPERASVPPDPENKFPLKSRPAPSETAAPKKVPKLEIVSAQAETAPDNLPVGEISAERHFKLEDRPERLEANGDFVKWRVDHIGSDGRLFMSVPQTEQQIVNGEKSRKAIIFPAELRAELKMGEKVREIAGENGATYDGLVNILSEVEKVPTGESEAAIVHDPENDELRKYLQENKGQILEYIAFIMEHQQMTMEQATAKAVGEARLATAAEDKHFFEVDYSLFADGLNKVAADFKARRGEAQSVLGEKTRLANIFSVTRGRPGLSDVKTEMSADEKIGAHQRELELAREAVFEPTIAAIKKGEVEPAQYPESTIAEREEQLKIDLEEALACLKTADEKTWPIERIRALEQRILEDYNELRVAKAEQVITDWQDLPPDWIDFLRAVKQAKLELGVAEKYVVPKPPEVTVDVMDDLTDITKEVSFSEEPKKAGGEQPTIQPVETALSPEEILRAEHPALSPEDIAMIVATQRRTKESKLISEAYSKKLAAEKAAKPKPSKQEMAERKAKVADILYGMPEKVEPTEKKSEVDPKILRVEKLISDKTPITIYRRSNGGLAKGQVRYLTPDKIDAFVAYPDSKGRERVKAVNVEELLRWQDGIFPPSQPTSDIEFEKEPKLEMPTETIQPRELQADIIGGGENIALAEIVKKEAQEIRQEIKKTPKKVTKPEKPPAAAVDDEANVSVRGGISEAAKRKAEAQPARPSLAKRAWNSFTSLFSGAQEAAANTEEQLGL